MKTPIIIAGLAALVLFNSKSTVKSEKSEKNTKSEYGTFKGTAVCTNLQYKNEKGKCEAFWIEGETDQFVLDEINNQIAKLQDQSFEALCADKVIDAYNAEYAKNDNLLKNCKSNDSFVMA